MLKFLQGQYDYIYFFYGLSFLYLFIVCFTLEKEKLGKLPWFSLGLFALLHTFNEWMEIYAINTEVGRIFSIAHLGVLAGSYLFLLEFARKGIWRTKSKGWWMYPVVFLLILFTNKQGINGLAISLRYLLGLPAGLLAAFSIYRVSNEETRDRKVLLVLSILMVFYSFTSGLIAPKSEFFPGNWINSESFNYTFGFPVQLLRGLIALFLAVTLWYYSPNLAGSEYNPHKYRLPFKPTKWIIMFSLVVLIGIGWVFTNYLDYYAGIQIIKNTKANRNSPLNKLIGELTRIEQSAYLLSRFSAVKTALISSKTEDIDKALVLMNKYRDRCSAFDALLLDARGRVVTSTDWSLPESKANKSYSNLAYFKDAIKGQTGYYFVPGDTYNERVYYVGFPIKDEEEKIIGVIAFKKIISVKPIMKYRLISIIITMFVCIITMVFFVVLRRKENLIEYIEDAHARLKTVDQMKTDFISIVSHELRTPLTAIKNAVSILIKKELNNNISEENKKDLLEIILKNTNRQTRMVNDLLDVSKIEAGVINVAMENSNVLDIVKEVFSSLEPVAREKEIQLKIICQKESLILEHDPEHLRRILTNLMVNAINFTPKNGQVCLKIESNQDNAIFNVSDTGIGICAEDQEKLFNKFYRAAEAKTRYKAGTGLGLVIAKGLVEIQGGKIWVESALGKGSCFIFTIPNKKISYT